MLKVKYIILTRKVSFFIYKFLIFSFLYLLINPSINPIRLFLDSNISQDESIYHPYNCILILCNMSNFCIFHICRMYEIIMIQLQIVIGVKCLCLIRNDLIYFILTIHLIVFHSEPTLIDLP